MHFSEIGCTGGKDSQDYGQRGFRKSELGSYRNSTKVSFYAKLISTKEATAATYEVAREILANSLKRNGDQLHREALQNHRP